MCVQDVVIDKTAVAGGRFHLHGIWLGYDLDGILSAQFAASAAELGIECEHRR